MFVTSFINPRFRFAPVCAAAAAALISTATTARADVKVVSQVTITGLPAGAASAQSSKPQTVTAYYKGTKVRTEAANTVTIYDGKTNMVTTLSPASKTYTVASVAAPAANPMMAMMDVKTTATLKPGGKTKTIAGKPAKNYVWQANIAMGMKPSAKQNANSQMPSGPLVTIQMNGEQWTTDAVKLPAGSKSMVMSMMSGPAKAIPGLSPLMDKFAQIKGLPLSATLTQAFKQSAAMMAMGGAKSNVPPKPITVTTNVLSLSEKPLTDTLFAVPAGYQKVAIKTPMMPGAM